MRYNRDKIYLYVLTGVLIMLLFVISAHAGELSIGTGAAPIYGEKKVWTETLATVNYRFESEPVQVYITRSPITYILGAEAINRPGWGNLEVFIGFAVQSEFKENPIVGSPIMYSFGFQLPTPIKDVRFVFRHQSSGNYFHSGPLCGSHDRCNTVANSGWNSLNLMWVFK